MKQKAKLKCYKKAGTVTAAQDSINQKNSAFSQWEADKKEWASNVANDGNKESKINYWLGNPKGKSQIEATSPPEWNPYAKQWQYEEPVDNIRHANAGRYTAEAIANKTGNIPYVSKALGYLGSNALGIGHEVGTYFTDPRWSKSGKSFIDKAKVITQEAAEDIYNNNYGAIVGSTNMSPLAKSLTIKHASWDGRIPDGQGEVHPFIDNRNWVDPYSKKKTGGLMFHLKKGGMIKRADGSYSQRGLWDNIRANKGSGKKPTPQMLAQEKKIKGYARAGVIEPTTESSPLDLSTPKLQTPKQLYSSTTATQPAFAPFEATQQDRTTWNDYQDYAKKQPDYGQPIWDTDVTHGQKSLDAYNLNHPESSIRTPADVARIQTSLTSLNQNPQQFSGNSRIFPAQSLNVDSVIGTRTSAARFPKITQENQQPHGTAIKEFGTDYENYSKEQPTWLNSPAARAINKQSYPDSRTDTISGWKMTYKKKGGVIDNGFTDSTPAVGRYEGGGGIEYADSKFWEDRPVQKRLKAPGYKSGNIVHSIPETMPITNKVAQGLIEHYPDRYGKYTPQQFISMMDSIGQVESKDKNIQQITNKGLGPANGYFQIEQKTTPTAFQRYRNYQGWMKDEVSLPNIKYKSDDVRNLSRDQQSALSLANMAASYKDKLDNGTDIGPLNPFHTMETWLAYHWKGNESEVPKHIKNWNNTFPQAKRIKPLPQEKENKTPFMLKSMRSPFYPDGYADGNVVKYTKEEHIPFVKENEGTALETWRAPNNYQYTQSVPEYLQTKKVEQKTSSPFANLSKAKLVNQHGAQYFAGNTGYNRLEDKFTSGLFPTGIHKQFKGQLGLDIGGDLDLLAMNYAKNTQSGINSRVTASANPTLKFKGSNGGIYGNAKVVGNLMLPTNYGLKENTQTFGGTDLTTPKFYKPQLNAYGSLGGGVYVDNPWGLNQGTTLKAGAVLDYNPQVGKVTPGVKIEHYGPLPLIRNRQAKGAVGLQLSNTKKPLSVSISTKFPFGSNKNQVAPVSNFEKGGKIKYKSSLQYKKK